MRPSNNRVSGSNSNEQHTKLAAAGINMLLTTLNTTKTLQYTINQLALSQCVFCIASKHLLSLAANCPFRQLHSSHNAPFYSIPLLATSGSWTHQLDKADCRCIHSNATCGMVAYHFSSHNLLNPGNSARLIGSQAVRSETALVDGLCQLNSIFKSLIHSLPCNHRSSPCQSYINQREAAVSLPHRKSYCRLSRVICLLIACIEQCSNESHCAIRQERTMQHSTDIHHDPSQPKSQHSSCTMLSKKHHHDRLLLNSAFQQHLCQQVCQQGCQQGAAEASPQQAYCLDVCST